MSRRKSGIPLIAELADVSIGTVDRALHGRPGINEETRNRILKIAAKIRYRPNQTARTLAIGRKIRIGLCVPREIAYFYNELWAGMRDEAQVYAETGLTFEEANVPALGVGDREAFKKLVASGVQGIVLTPGDPDSMNGLINDAENAGVRVVCVSTDAPLSKRSSIVCTEPRLNGLIAGELMARFVGSGDEVAIITGMLKTVDHREKTEGFTEAYSKYNPGGRVAATIEAHENEKESYERTKTLLRTLPDLAGIYVNTVNCLPVCRALTETKRAGAVRLITTDLFKKMVPYIESGVIAASMHQRPYRQGQQAVRVLSEHLLRGVELRPSYYMNPSQVLRSNLYTYREAAGLQKQSREVVVSGKV